MGEYEPPPRLPPWRGWAPILILPPAVVLLTPADWPRWAYMWAICATLFAGLKWLTWRRTPAPHASLGRHLGYLFAWPGLDAVAFLRGQCPAPGERCGVSPPVPANLRRAARQSPPRPTIGEWLDAASKLAAGIVVLWAIVRLIPAEDDLLRGWIGMIGIVLALHFGPFHLLSCAWRAAGVDARRLMNAPLAATSVSEFWGRRWNTAFRDLTYRFLFRPLTAWLGARSALAAGFVFSGLVHELAISVPAGAGYGGPTLFFCVQVPAMLIERSRVGRALGLGHGWRGWLFTAVALVAPAGLLFHPPFVRTIVLPFLHVLGVCDA